MKDDIYFLKIPVPYQVEYIKKGCRKSQISTIIENVEIPIEILPKTLNPIATLTHADIGNNITEYDYQERIRKGDYLFFEYKDELYTTYIDFFEKSNNKHFYPMNNSIFRESLERINGESFVQIKSYLEQNDTKKIAKYIINDYMESLGLKCDLIENYISEIPNDAKILSNNRDNRINNILSQTQNWKIFNDRLYLPTSGLNCYIKFSNDDKNININISNPNVKNDIYQKRLEKQSCEHIKYLQGDKIPLSMALSFIDDNVGDITLNISRSMLNIHNLEKFLSYEEPNIFLNNFMNNIDYNFSNGIVFDLNTSIDEILLFSELCKFRQKNMSDITIDELILMNKNIEILIQKTNYSLKQMSLFSKYFTDTHLDKNRSFIAQKDQYYDVTCFFDDIEPSLHHAKGIS
jgi:hypothetical protein